MKGTTYSLFTLLNHSLGEDPAHGLEADPTVPIEPSDDCGPH